MRLLRHAELSTITGAALRTPLDPTIAKLQQEVVQRVLSVTVDPYGSTVGLTLLGVSQTLKMPSQVMSLLQKGNGLL